MIQIEKTQIMGWEPTIRGMRNPMNSWEKSDSGHRCPYKEENAPICGNCTENMCIGPNDLDLMLRLAKAGSVDGKFRRMIAVYVDLTAPLYWWKEFDTYKVGTVANSCSTMHKIHSKPFTLDDFSHEHLLTLDSVVIDDLIPLDKDETNCLCPVEFLELTCKVLNRYREKFLETKDKSYWWQMIQLLPSSYNQKRTVMLNYEVLANIYQHRRNHKLDEWRELCRWIKSLPYSEIITCNVTEKDKTNALTAAIAKLKSELQWSDDRIASFLLEQAKLTGIIAPITFL